MLSISNDSEVLIARPSCLGRSYHQLRGIAFNRETCIHVVVVNSHWSPVVFGGENFVASRVQGI